MTVNQISVFLENKPGQLAELTQTLSENDISMRARSIADTRDYGIARLITNDPYKTAMVLREAGWVSKMTPVLAVRMADEAGALQQILDVLAKANIALEYVYAFLSSKANSACMVVRVQDTDTAAKALRAGGINLITQDELSNM